jgi:hypothetical protein
MSIQASPKKSIWKRWWMFVVYAFVALGILGALLPEEKEKTAAPKTTAVALVDLPATTTTTAAPATPATTAATTVEQPAPATTEAAAEATAPAPKDPKAIKLRGSGSKVTKIRLKEDLPAIVKVTNSGSSNFIVNLRQAGGQDLLVNEIGRYSGTVVASDTASGTATLQIESSGSWTAEITQPVAFPKRTLPAKLHGKGSQVYRVLSVGTTEWTTKATHRGSSNFIVEMVGYGEASGSTLLFNEIGRYSGETIAETPDIATMLVAIEADGPWTLDFRE